MPESDQAPSVVEAPRHQGWLAPEPVVERIPLDAASWIDVVRGFLPRATEVRDDLLASVRWEQGRVFRYERWVDDPRLSGWQAGNQRHPALVEAQTWITRRYRTPFDGVALAWYRDGRDSVAYHRDRELKWLEDTVIGVLTMGATRPFLVRPLTGRKAEYDAERYGDAVPDDAMDLRPASGDLLVMGGRCQAAWLHAVPKVRGPVGARVSAQWRWTSKRGRPDMNPSYYAPRRFSR